MFSWLRIRIGLVALCVVAVARAQTPTLTATLPDRGFSPGGAAATIDLRDYFGLPGVTGTLVQFDTDFGKFNVELRADAAPATVANFLSYVNAGSYSNSFFHRSVPSFVIQGGGFLAQSNLAAIPANAPIALESALPNVRGSLAMARTNTPDSATTQWFINTVDNSSGLAPGTSGGYAVFGRVLGTGMTVVDEIAAQPTFSLGADPFRELPLRNVQPGQTQLFVENLIKVKRTDVVATYPDGSGTSVLAFDAQSSAAAVASVALNGSTLTVTPGTQPGTSTITVTVTDTNGNTATGSFAVTVQKQSQVISFAGPTDQPFSFQQVMLSATSSSGLPVSFELVAGSARVQQSTLTLSGTGTVTVRATQAGDDTYAAAAPVERSFTVTANYLSWSADRFSPEEMANPAVSGPGVVLAGDGLSNLMKYALGLEPRVPATPTLAMSATGSDWVFTYTRPSDRAELSYSVEASANLVDWSASGVMHERVAIADGWETWTARVSLAAGSRMFFRLVVTQP